MAVTTRRAPSSAAPDSSPLPASSDDSTMPTKMSREVRKLQIDAEAALLGNGSLKRKRSAPGANANPEISVMPPTPPLSQSNPSNVPTPRAPAEDQEYASTTSPTPARKSASAKTEVARPAKRRRTAHTSPTPEEITTKREEEESREDTFAQLNQVISKESERLRDNNRFWFMPDIPDEASDNDQATTNHDTSNSPKPESAATRGSPSPESTNAARQTSSKEEDGSKEVIVVSSELDETEQKKIAKPSKKSRELSRLQIDANEALTGQTSFNTDSDQRSRSQKRKRKTDELEQEPEPESAHVERKKVLAEVAEAQDKEEGGGPDAQEEAEQEPEEGKAKKAQKYTREMRRLQINANPSLGGASTEPPPAKRRRVNPYTKDSHHKSSRPAGRPWKESVYDMPPGPPPDWAVDGFLIYVAEITGDIETVKTLQGGRAQDAVKGMGGIRHETESEQIMRMNEELAIIQGWDLVPTARTAAEKTQKVLGTGGDVVEDNEVVVVGGGEAVVEKKRWKGKGRAV